jgi:hypothetical protein
MSGEASADAGAPPADAPRILFGTSSLMDAIKARNVERIKYLLESPEARACTLEWLNHQDFVSVSASSRSGPVSH